MCCGQKRSKLRTIPAPIPTRSVGRSLPANRQSPVPGTQPAPSERITSLKNPRLDPPLQPIAPVPVTTSTPESSLAVRYLESFPVLVQGLATGRRYEFSSSQPVQNVDSRDVSTLLSTRSFSLA